MEDEWVMNEWIGKLIDGLIDGWVDLLHDD